MSTYEKIADLCKKNGISITGLESELGFGRGSIGKMKKGSNTSYDRLQKIADRFGVTVEYLVNDDSEVESHISVQTFEPHEYYYDDATLKMAQELYLNKELHLLFDAARDVDKDDLFFVYSLIQRMKKNKNE